VSAATGCPLCESDGGTVVARTSRWRLVRADEAGFPGFYRLVWNAHVREFSDLPPSERLECAELLAQVESLLRRHLQPTKVNLASLGNAVPHLHWHIVARFDWDSHFPGSVWSQPQRAAPPQRLAHAQALLPALEGQLAGLAGAG
jgi:diadenosine tetraphosphate (Ap4A) HIT family hydrolase